MTPKPDNPNLRIEHDPVGVMKAWCEFGEHRAYILMAIARRKHNEELTHNSEVVYREVLRDEQDIQRKYDDLCALIGNHDYTFRIYLTVNARNTLDGYFNFQEEMNGWSRDLIRGDEHAAAKMGEVGSRWISALHRPAAKDDSYFQFDVDGVSVEGMRKFVESLEDETEVLMGRETPNGYHILTEPFNYPNWEPPVVYDDLDTDGQLFIEEVEQR